MRKHPPFPATSPSLFPTASQFAISGGHFIQNNVNMGGMGERRDNLALLYDEVAPNAILNAGGRPDPVRCYPGTREEVMERIELWKASGYKSDRRVFWLSGPAGAGKSAIMQTIAERWTERKVPLANFFFYRSDPSRSHTQALVATLIYQLFSQYPELKDHVNSILDDDPVILRHSLHSKFGKLVKEPIYFIRRFDPSRSPIVLLIDGLDECDSHSGRAEQLSLLQILHDLVTSHESPFIALVASRPEPHLMMRFNELGTFHASIFLDESYRPADDIRKFVVGEMARIKNAHSLGYTLDRNWPTETIITSIVNKSSGQFIYAATLARFVGNSSASPAVSMQIVLGLRPITKNSPFSEIDAIYSYILSQAEDWNAVHDVFATHKILSSFTTRPGRNDFNGPVLLTTVISSLGYFQRDVESCLANLAAIVRLDAHQFSLHFYHASLGDFLYDRMRAGIFYIDLNSVACRLVTERFLHSVTIGLDSLRLNLHIFNHISDPSGPVGDALQRWNPDCNLETPSLLSPHKNDVDVPFAPVALQFLDKIENLYSHKDRQLCTSIGTLWTAWFERNSISSLMERKIRLSEGNREVKRKRMNFDPWGHARQNLG